MCVLLHVCMHAPLLKVKLLIVCGMELMSVPMCGMERSWLLTHVGHAVAQLVACLWVL